MNRPNSDWLRLSNIQCICVVAVLSAERLKLILGCNGENSPSVTNEVGDFASTTLMGIFWFRPVGMRRISSYLFPTTP